MPTTSHQSQATFELQDLSNMDRIRSLFRPRPDYEPLQNDAERDDESVQDDVDDTASESPFSWVEYAIFLLLGIAMLWAW
jgi:equilibrative nucleoside transporter 1/2/3